MLRSYLTPRRRYVIDVEFATGARRTYGPFLTRFRAQALLRTRWMTDAQPDPHDKYSDVVSATVRLRHAGEPDRPAVDLMGRRFIQA